MIIIDIELKKPNPLKDFLRKLHSRLEDMMFSIIIQKLPEKYIPHPFMDWLDHYLTKRISQLNQETIKITWQNMYLQKAVDEIKAQQQNLEQ